MKSEVRPLAPMGGTRFRTTTARAEVSERRGLATRCSSSVSTWRTQSTTWLVL